MPEEGSLTKLKQKPKYIYMYVYYIYISGLTVNQHLIMIPCTFLYCALCNLCFGMEGFHVRAEFLNLTTTQDISSLLSLFNAAVVNCSAAFWGSLIFLAISIAS